MSNTNDEPSVNIKLCGLQHAKCQLTPVDVHHLPCKINYDGCADVNSFWRVHPSNEVSSSIVDSSGKPAQILNAVFRGRLLNGAIQTMPKGLFIRLLSLYF